MSGLPFYKRYPSNAISGMQALSLEERGAYNTLIDLIYDNGGPVKDDEKTLRAYMNCDVRTWRRVRAALIEKEKITLTEDGRIANGRATRELTSPGSSPEVRPKFARSSPEVRPKSDGKGNKNNGATRNSKSPITRSQSDKRAPAALALITGRDAPVLPLNGKPAISPEERELVGGKMRQLALDMAAGKFRPVVIPEARAPPG